MLGVGITVKFTPLLSTPLACTTTLPVVAPDGTVATTLDALQVLTVAVVPLNFTVLLPWVDPKFVPVIVTDTLTAPEVGDRLVMLGDGKTVKPEPWMSMPLAWTTTLTVVAPDGTGTAMVVLLPVVGVSVVQLNVAVLCS